ncbi:right-handed parallel beta-helix repeat-containing protein [Marinifilum flexuosum]|uniref:right-handed parallel beta-helix repeat-containing protein n=1 Tax=Marinifilum flexuosum TaxID=1117708 RepID=UPI0024923000|nr:right-handed parallel beta-helix repeat-containing protein [Marinifilum flexuosum]
MKYRELIKTILVSTLLSISWVLNAQTNISGEVNGVWTKEKSPYLIDGDISVTQDNKLTIEPGVKVKFTGYYKVDIKGTLLAIGTANEMIHFTVADASGWNNRDTNDGGWGGIRFDRTQASDTSKIEFCKFEYGKAMGSGWEEDNAGGAIFIDGFSRLRIQNSIFTNNWARWNGGAIYCDGANPVFENLLIYNNKAERSGGGICIESNSSAKPELINLTITKNVSEKGGGISCDWGCSPNVINTIIWDNDASSGSQIYLSEENADPNFINCIVEGGTSFFGGNGSYLNFNGKFENCMKVNPQFVNPEAFNFQLKNNSHAINTGKLFDPKLADHTDINGKKRLYGSDIDMGAYECQSAPANRIPILKDLPNLQTKVDTPVEFEVSFFDPDSNDNHKVTVSSNVSGTEVVKLGSESNPAKYKVVQPSGWRGTMTVSVQVVDDSKQTYNLNTKSFNIKVANNLNAGGDITENTVWDADTISVISNIKIHDDVLLEISAGTIVEFQGKYGINVFGTIAAIGNKTDSIVFRGKDNSTKWSGIQFVNDWAGAGGVMNDNDSTKFVNCVFTGVSNYNEIKGAIYMRSYSKVLIKGCRISNNVSGYGAITCYSGSNPRIDGNLISYNEANQHGGGIWCDQSSPAIVNNTIIYNGHVHVPQLGGGIALQNSNAYIANNVIAHNLARSSGGGISCYYSSNPKIINNTISNNSAHSEGNSRGYGGGIVCDKNSKPEIINCILWNNTNKEGNDQLHLFTKDNFPSIQHCVIQGGLEGISDLSVDALNELKKLSKNNLTHDPEYRNAESLDFNLQSNSPCIDRGTADTTGLSLPKMDYLGKPRIANESIDIGAIEFQGKSTNKKPLLERHDAVSSLVNAPIEMYVIFEDLDDGDTHTISVVSDHPDVKIERINGNTSGSTYNIVPTENWTGSANITVKVTDNSGESNASDSYSYPLTIMETACGDILGNTIWSQDTVKVTCDVTVSENATLQIKAGTVIEFQNHDRLNVYGKLMALGTLNDSIRFTVKDTSKYSQYYNHTGWNGVRFYNNQKDTSVLEYTRFEYGKAKKEGDYYHEDNSGGAVFISDYKNINISNCYFYRNYSDQGGSAIYSKNGSPVISQCKFHKNKARTGTIVVNRKAQLIDNLISNNTSSEMAAGIICADSTLIKGNRIVNNEGSGMRITGSPIILNTIICNNSGVGISTYDCNSKKISNIIVYNNGSDEHGFALSMWTSYLDIYNSVIKGGIDAGWGYPTFYNCSLDVNGDYSKDHNDVNCIYSEPGFVSPSAGSGKEYDAIKADWSLLATSTCINSGIDPNIEEFDTDIIGNPRVVHGVIDIGPFEYQLKPANRRPLIEKMDDKKIPPFSEMELAVYFSDQDEEDLHSISIKSNTPHVKITELSGDTIGSTFNVVSPDEWYGTAQITIEVKDNSESENSIALDTVNVTVTNRLCGHITNNSKWFGDNVRISCPLTVDDEVTLRIMPGTHVEFEKDASLEVIGALLAEGNKTDSIVFTAENRENGWSGINFKNGFYAYGHPSGVMDDTCKLSYCKFEYCKSQVLFVDDFDKLWVSNSRFVNNQGSCIKIYEASPTIIDNVFELNSTTYYESGTIWIERYSNPIIRRNIIRNNSALLGGGINCDYHSNPLIANNLIYGNSANSGGGIYCTQSSPTIVNNTIVNNTAKNGAGIYCSYSEPGLYNSIVWGNEATEDTYQIYRHKNAGKISNCMIPEDGLYLDGDNKKTGLIISKSPNFVNESAHDYHLASNSYCINTGSNDYCEQNNITLDLFGNSRFNEERADMGAYEFQGVPDEMNPIVVTLSSEQIYENKPIRTLVGLLSTLDPNVKDTHAYSIEKEDGEDSEFMIVGDSLFSAMEFDYETQNNYSISIVSTDQTGRSVSKEFTIAIRNANDFPILLNPIPDVIGSDEEEFYFKIPENTFYKDEYETLNYTAKLVDSNFLPSWLSFDQYRGIFTSSNPEAGTYNIEVTANDWQYTSEPDTFLLTITGIPTSVDEIPEINQIVVYPNPSSRYFYVKGISSDITRYKVINMYGRVILEKDIIDQNSILKINLSNYPDGFYLLQLIGKSKSKTYKLIKG